MAQAFIYTSVIPVDVLTLFSMITAAVLGAWLGAGVVSSWPKRAVQVGMGSALLVAAVLMLITQLQRCGRQILPLGGEALGVRGVLLVVAIAGNFMLGALMTLGIGLYAPVHDPHQPARDEPDDGVSNHDGVLRVPDAGRQPALHPRARYSLRAALGLAIGGIPACSWPPTS